MAFRGERYETLRVIASGGMATVHLGRALGAGGFERLVAIKVMHPHLATEPEFTAMFLDEARLAARIRHPNVVSTVDVQSDAEGVFLVMDYIEGPSLQQIFRALSRSGSKMPLDVFFRIFLDALTGLHAAHELKDSADRPLHLVHRDVSPQNILVGADGIGRITDFGVASAEARLSSTYGGQLKGKLGYMAPEQARSRPVDRRTDIYAAGVILWEVLAGGRRFRSGNESALLASVTEEPARPLRDIHPSVPEPLEECCMRALAQEPEGRYSTGADFVEALEKAIAASGLSIASGRKVAAFVTELQAHERPIDLPAPPPPSRASIALSPPPPQRRSLPESPAAPTDTSLHETVPELRASVADRSQPSVSPAPHLASEASIPVVASPARRSPRRLLLGVGAALLVGVVALVLGTRGSGEPAASGATAMDATSKGLSTTPSAAPSRMEPSPPPAAPANSTADPASLPPLSPSASAVPRPQPVSTSAPLAPTATVRTAAPDASKAPHDRPSDKPASTSPVYRPPDL